MRLNGVHRLAADTPTLARVLQSAGYRTGAVIGAYVLDRRFGLGEGFDTYDDDIARGDLEAGLLEAERRGTSSRTRRSPGWKALPADGPPFYLWVHLYDPHAPYAPPPAWLERARGQPYDGEVAYADAQLGRIIEALAARGLSDRTLIVVAGDHGESLGDHDEQTHGWLVYEKAIDVPLVFSAAGLPTSPRTDAASLVDVLPTVLGLLGLPPPPGLDGRDLFAAGASRADAETYAETHYPQAAGCSPLYALVSGRWKYIGGPATPELYDLDDRFRRAARRGRRAPFGRRLDGIARRGDDDRARAAERADRPVARRRGAPPRARVRRRDRDPPPARTVAAAAAAPASPRVRDWERFQQALSIWPPADERRPDRRWPTSSAESRTPRSSTATTRGHWTSPASRSAAVDEYRRALATVAGEYDVAPRVCRGGTQRRHAGRAMKAEEAVVALDPTDAAAHNGIGLLHTDAGRSRPGTRRVRAGRRDRPARCARTGSTWATRDGPSRTGRAPSAPIGRRSGSMQASPDALNGLGVLLVQAGRAAEAVSWFQRALSAAPRFYEAWLNLGIACHESGDLDRAREAYRQVLAIAPEGSEERAAASRLLASAAVGSKR